ncbi:MAG: hypothetical protein WBC59_07745 [Phycisphaerae bacterium]
MMRIINFLPADHVEKRGRRRANLVCLGLAAVAALALGLISAICVARAAGVAGLRRLIDQQYRDAGQQINQLKKLEQRKEGLLRKVELSADLLERVPRSHILARVTKALPLRTSVQVFTMSVEEVEMVTEKPPEGESTEKGQSAGQAATRGGKKKGRVPTVKVKQTRFTLVGLAPTDVEVAELISRLNTDPVFEGVNLQFSEEFPYAEDVQMRRFKLSFWLSAEAKRILESFTGPGQDPVEPDAPIAGSDL